MIKFTLVKVKRRGRRPSVFKPYVLKKTRKDKVIQKLAKKSGVSYEYALLISNALKRMMIENGFEYVRTTIEGLKRWEIFDKKTLKKLKKMGF